MTRAPAVVALLALGPLAGCAHALQPLPSESELAPVPPERADPAAAEHLIEQADGAWAERPDVAAVRRAEELYLQAATKTPEAAPVIGAVQAQVWLASHVPEQERAEVATTAVRTAQWCAVRDDGDPACDYWLALALGVQADARRSTALDALGHMVRLLRQAAEAAPDMERAGPDRVLARVLASAPGWPSGPGDPDEALEHALEAVRRFPDHAPNQLALAEAYDKLDRPGDRRAAYARALRLAEAAVAAGEPDAREWVNAARAGLGDQTPGHSQPNTPAVSRP